MIDKKWHTLVHLSSILIIKNDKEFFMPIFALKSTHRPCFKILWINLILTSKHDVHDNSTTNIECNALKTTLS